MAGGAGWYGFTGFIGTGTWFDVSGLTHVEATAQFASESAALAYAQKTWGSHVTYKFLGFGSDAVSEAEDLLKSGGQGAVLVSGPYATQAEAENFVTTEQTGAGATTTTTNSTDTQGPSLSGIDAIGQFFSNIGEANTWIRVGEAVLGLILIAIGLARITHAVPIATSIAKTAGAAAV